MNNLFQKSLADLVRGIRTNKKNESQYIASCLSEIKDEVRSNDAQRKMVAVAKLTYLHMLGYDMSFAAFHIIEVMSQPKFTAKRIGYLAASQCFNDQTEVLTLATNLIRKDMTSTNVWESGAAINCLSNVCTPELARDLAPDVVAMLNNSKPYIRKKACLVLYKVFLRFPDSLRPAFPRLKEKLEDPDPSVVSAAVNVICELARRNPKNYISLAPTLYKILTNSSNNWMLIKIVKLFGALLPIEERLAKKLVGPLGNLLSSTQALSLLYEVIQTCTTGLADHLPTIKLCIQKLRTFIEDPDQNLKYLGLVALNNIMKIQPKAVAEHKDMVMHCLEDEDTSIRLRALDLIQGMISKKNLAEITDKLLEFVDKSDGVYRESLIQTIVNVCSASDYANVTDFEWYISVLVHISHISGTKSGKLLCAQMMDVIIRVEMVRAYGVKQMLTLLKSTDLLSDNVAEGSNCEVLFGAAWLVGEYSKYVTDYFGAIVSLLQPRALALPQHIQSSFVQTVTKLFATVAHKASTSEGGEGKVDAAALERITDTIKSDIAPFTSSQYTEVQERACFLSELLTLYKEVSSSGQSLAGEISTLFEEPLNPVSSKAQKKVKVPEGLNLDDWINTPPPDDEKSFEDTGGFTEDFGKFSDGEEETKKSDPADLEARKQAKARVYQGPYYLGGDSPKNGREEPESPKQENLNEDLGPLKVDPSSSSSSSSHKIKKPSSSKKKQFTVAKVDTGPDGDSDDDKEKKQDDNPWAGIDLNAPLRNDEQLVRSAHRVVKSPSTSEVKKPEEKKESSREKESSSSSKDKKERKEKKEKKDKKDKKDKKEKSSSSSTPATTNSSSLINFDGNTPVTSPEPKTPTNNAVYMLGKATKSPEPEKKSEEKKEKSSSSSSSSSTSTSKSTSVLKYKPLCQDERIAVIYELRCNPKEPRKILVAFMFKNTSGSAIGSITFSFAPTLNARPIKEANLNAPNLDASSTNKHNIIFEVSAFAQTQRVGGLLTYKIGSTEHKKDFQIVLPTSAFFIPVKLSEPDFIKTLKTEKFSHLSTSVKADKGDFRTFVAALSATFHLEIIVGDDKTASLYGQSVQGHKLCMYTKSSPTAYSVDLKCTDSAISESIIGELNEFWR